MGLSVDLATYADCKIVLDTVVERGETLTYTLDSAARAHYFRFRLQQFRKLTRKAEAARVNMKPFTVATPYDNLQFRLNGPSVIIEYVTVVGRLTNAAGEPVTPVKATIALPVNTDDQTLIDDLRGLVNKEEVL